MGLISRVSSRTYRRPFTMLRRVNLQKITHSTSLSTRNLSASTGCYNTSDGVKLAKVTQQRKPQLDDHGIAELQMESDLEANQLRKPKSFFKDISSDAARDETLLRIDLPKISTQDHFKNIPIEFISA